MSYVDISGGKQRSRTPSHFWEPSFQGWSQDQPRCITFLIWCPRGDLNSQNLVSKTSTYTNSVTRAKFVCILLISLYSIYKGEFLGLCGRIRTCGLLVPNQAVWPDWHYTQIKCFTDRTYTDNILLHLGALLLPKPIKGIAPAIDDKLWSGISESNWWHLLGRKTFYH